MELVYKELKYFKDVHKVEYNYFWADTFLGMSNNEMDEFCEMYSEINLPFGCKQDLRLLMMTI